MWQRFLNEGRGSTRLNDPCKSAETAPGECLFAHPPSARTRAVWLTAAELTALWPCNWPSEKSQRQTSLLPLWLQGSKSHNGHRRLETLQATSYFEPTPLAHSTRAQAKVTRSAIPVVQVCASNRDASAALCCLTDARHQHENWRVRRHKSKILRGARITPATPHEV